MGKPILESYLGAFTGVIALMALAYLSVELIGAGPVTVAGASTKEPVLKSAPAQLHDGEQVPIVMMTAPQPVLVSELKP